MAEEVTLPTLKDILKTQKENGKTFNKGFNLLNKNIINSIKSNISVGKSITGAVTAMTKMAQGNAKDMIDGFSGLLDAERKALEFDKQQAIAQEMKNKENARENAKKGDPLKLPNFKSLIDPKSWMNQAKGFVGSMFGMLTGLVTSVLAPLMLGAFQGYYESLVKAMRAPFRFLKLALFTPLRFARDISATVVKTFLKIIDLLTFGKMKEVTGTIELLTNKVLNMFNPISKVFDNLSANLDAKLPDIETKGTRAVGFFDKVKGFFNLSIFSTDLSKGMPTYAESPLGKFISKSKNWFFVGTWEESAKAIDIDTPTADTIKKSPSFSLIDKVKGFFKLPDFTKFTEKFTLPKFADSSLGKFIDGVKGLFNFSGIGDEVTKMIDLLKTGIKESAVFKFFSKIGSFFGMSGEGKGKGPFAGLMETFKKVFDFELPSGLQKFLTGIGKVFGKIFFIFDIFMGVYEAVKAFTSTEGSFADKMIAALKAFINEVVFGLPNFLIEMVGKGVSKLLEFLGFGDQAKAVEDATKDFSMMDLISDSIGKVWKWMKDFFGNLFNFENMSLESLMPSFDFDMVSPLKMIGEKLSGILKSMGDGLNDSIVPGTGSLAEIIYGLADKVAQWGGDEPGGGGDKPKLKQRAGGMIPQRVTGDQVPAILHANEVVLAENSAKLFLQAAQMFARPEYANAIKDLVKTNSDIKTQTTDALMQAGAMQGSDGGASAMIGALMQQNNQISQTMAQIPDAVMAGANRGTFQGSQVKGHTAVHSNPHERKPKH